MDLKEVKIMIRSLVTSSQVSCRVHHLLRDFKNETGMDLPLFGYDTAVEFLKSIPDTVRLGSSTTNPEVFLVESEKSAHVSALVQEQRTNPKLAFLKKRVVVSSQEKKDQSSYYIPKLFEAVNRHPPSLSPYANWNYNTTAGRYSWCKSPHLHACTLHCIQAESNRVNYFNNLLYNAATRDYSNWRTFPAAYSRSTHQSDYLKSNYPTNYSRSRYTADYSRKEYTSDYSKSGYPILGRHNPNQNRINQTTFEEAKIWDQPKEEATPPVPGQESEFKEFTKTLDTASLKEEESKREIKVAEKIENDDDISNSDHFEKISNADREKLKKYIDDHPNGATISELLGILTINKKNSQVWKKSVTVDDIIASCSAFSVFIDNKFYKNGTTQEEVNLKKEPKVAVRKHFEPILSKKPIEIRTKLIQDVGKKKSEINKKSGLIFDEFEDFKMGDLTEPSGPNETFNYCKVNDKVQKKLSQLIKKFPNGLWCCDLREKYYEVYNSLLDFKDFGCTSMIEMIYQLPGIFRPYRPGQGDWILFDASAPISEEEKKYLTVPVKSINVPKCIKSEISKLLFANDLGVFIEDIAEAYFKMYRKKLDYESIGFHDLKTFLESLEGEIVHLNKIENTILVTPLKKKVVIEEPESVVEAIPPIQPDDELFIELFPENVFGPNERIQELELENIMEVGSLVEVVVAEVWTPHKFYVTLKEYDQNLDSLMKDLEYFFSNNLEKFEMPPSTLQPKQICAAYYNDKEVEEKWHRAEIIKVISEKKISVKLIDYGTTMVTRPSRLRFLPKDFGSLPVQAILASLAHVQPPNAEPHWAESSNQKFLDLVSAPVMFMEVLDINYKKRSTIVNLFEKEIINKEDKFIDIAECLIIHKYATYSEEILEKICGQKIEEKEKGELEKPQQPKLKPLEIIVQEKSKTCQSIGIVSPIRQDVSPIPPGFTKESTPNIPFVQSTINSNISYAAEVPSVSAPVPTIPASFPTVPVVSNQSTPQPQSKPQPAPSNPPPELDPLTVYLQTQFQLQLAYLRQHQLIEAEKQKQINKMALEILQSNPDVKKVADTDLNGALRLAMSLAEAYYGNSQRILLQNANSTMNLGQGAGSSLINPTPTPLAPSSIPLGSQINSAQAPASFLNPTPAPTNSNTNPKSAPAASYTNLQPSLPGNSIHSTTAPAASYSAPTPTASANPVLLQNINKDEDKEMNSITNKLLPLNITDPPSKKENPFRRYVKEIKIEGRTLHLINFNNRPYICAEQLRRLYSPFSSWDVTEKVLAAKKISFDYEIIKKDSPVYEELEINNSFKISEYCDSQADCLRLLPLSKVTRFLYTFKALSEEALVAFTELLEDFDHKDKYWTNP